MNEWKVTYLLFSHIYFLPFKIYSSKIYKKKMKVAQFDERMILTSFYKIDWKHPLGLTSPEKKYQVNEIIYLQSFFTKFY